MKCGVIIVGAGQGTRLGFNLPKAFVSLGSKPIFQYSLETFLSHPKMNEIVLVLPSEKLNAVPKGKFRVVAGGETRQVSVANGLKALSADCETVLVHDAARPFVTHEIIDRLVQSLQAKKNCIAAWPASDTLKSISKNLIEKTLDRKNIMCAQTPQAFFVSVLKEALLDAQKNNFIGTDESSLVERLGISVETVLGDPWNIKITTPQDLELAQAIADLLRAGE